MNEYERHMGAAGDPAAGGITPGPGANRERTPQEIEREIEMTRERMSRDIDALGEKLSPQNLKRQAKEAITGKAHDVVNNVGDSARDTGSRLFDFIRENPLPVAAVGLGAVWLIQQRNRSEISGDRMARFAYTGPERRSTGLKRRIADRAGEVRERVGEATSSVTERAGEIAGTARERVGDLGHEARERLGDLRSRARERGQRARYGLEHMTQDNPLAVAAGAAVLGLALGLLVPETQRENRLMGPARDNLVDRAQTTAERVKDATVEAAQEVREVVREEAEYRAPEIKSAIKDAAATVGAQVKDAAGRVKEEAKQAAKESKSGGRGTTPA
jgi:ElaB/YqjD/DUF883 family membrane-anchored ribosome-binding protein